MNIEVHQKGDVKIVEVTSENILINNTEEGLQLLADLYYQDTDRIIIHEKNLTPEFFDLQNGIAGEILQKFSNYRVRLAIIGDFSKYTRKSMTDFIRESNRGRQINFLESVDQAIEKLSA